MSYLLTVSILMFLTLDNIYLSRIQASSAQTKTIYLSAMLGVVTSIPNETYSEFQNASLLHATTNSPVYDYISHDDRTTVYQTTAPLETTPEDEQEKEMKELKVIFSYRTSGFVQSWDNGLDLYKPNSDMWSETVVPADNVVMLSFTFLDVEGYVSGCIDSVSLFLGNKSELNRIWKACESFYPYPGVYRTDKFLFHFKTDINNRPGPQFSGFRIRFSFHGYLQQPKMLSNEMWNCSVPYWYTFQQHLHCNLEVECSDSRDEDDCYYTDELCGPGRFRAGNACFMYVNLRRKITGEKAKEECYKRRGKLASLTTEDVWNNVTVILWTRCVRQIFVGFEVTPLNLPDVYHNLYQWSDGLIAYYVHMNDEQDVGGCAILQTQLYKVKLGFHRNCRIGLYYPLLCQLQGEKVEESKAMAPSSSFVLPMETWWPSNVSVVECPASHVTHTFLAYDGASMCWATSTFSGLAHSARLMPPPPSFMCNTGVQSVPYTLVCDHRTDCNDGSDENFCDFPECDWLKEFHCGGAQCIPEDQVCDGHKQCMLGNDEAQCVEWYKHVTFHSPTVPAIVNFDSDLNLHFTVIDTSTNITSCPNTHFKCIPNGYCLPVFLRCNKVNDCPDKTDELDCKDYTCPGFYRCRGSLVCVHPDNMCDGVFHCPQHDDELLCDLNCPENCTCYGWAFYCSQPFPVNEYPKLRFLDAKGSMLNVSDILQNIMLVHLSLGGCGLTNLKGLALPRLKFLDVRDNRLEFVKTSELGLVSKLEVFLLAGNPLVKELFVQDTSEHFALPTLHLLDLGRISLKTLNTSVLSLFPNLNILNFSSCNIQHISEDGFGFLSRLTAIDLRGSDSTFFPNNLFSGLSDLQSLYADNFKLCCSDILPKEFNSLNCHAPTDEISSCDDLLRSHFYRIILFLLSSLAVTSNFGSFVLRTCCAPSKALGFGTLVTHLCLSDFLMGIYLLIIGIADQIYRNTYLWKDIEWRRSAACKAAGFLSLLSSEVSAFVICLITLDRFVVLRFPFSQLHFSRTSAHAACAVAWGIGFLLATVPLLSLTSHWDFYGHTGICIPLPITRQQFAGQSYSFGVMIVLNFVLFLVVGIGQISIYWSIRTNSLSSSSSSKPSKDLTIARRLITVAVSDFLCWFPIGLLGLLSSRGFPISGEVNVALAIVALPLNSAINPFLYTLNTYLERRRQAKEERLKKLACVQRTTTTDKSDHKDENP